jgi:hypothetical protein
VNTEGITLFKGGAKVIEESLGSTNVSQKWKIVHPMNTTGKQGSGQNGKSGIFCSADLDGASERTTTFDDYFIHLFYCLQNLGFK